MSAERLRPVTQRDLPDLVALLDAAFSGHGESMDWTLDLLQGFWSWRWGDGGLSRLSTEEDGPLAGVAMADRRAATFDGVSLATAHIGPVGVHPDRRGRGLGTALMEAVEQAASEEAGVDLLTLTTERRHRAHRLYRRLGYGVVETFRPRVAILDGPALLRSVGRAALAPMGALVTLRGLDGHGAAEVAGERSAKTGRPGAIREQPLPSLPVCMPARCFGVGEARVAIAVLPAVTRSGERRTMSVAQVLAVHRGDGLRAASEAALAWARKQGCTTAFVLPAAGPAPRVWLPLGPCMLRMAKPLTESGGRALEAATAWDEWAPAS